MTSLLADNRQLAGWGCFPRHNCRVFSPRDEEQLCSVLAAGVPVIARGNGRAYGDSAVGETVIDMRCFSHMLDFDEQSGRLIVEAGALLSDIIACFLPRGWFPAVSPGTKFVTVGGMIAADIHGKNHHQDGSIGNFIDWIDLLGPDGSVKRCQPGTALFDWTLGGMGLTGIILRAGLRLRKVSSGWIRQELIPTSNLAETMEIFAQRQEATYSVAWLDCLGSGSNLGRSLVMLGEHAKPDQLSPLSREKPFALSLRRERRVPRLMPPLLLNRWSVGLFNAIYYRLGRGKSGISLIDWDRYFYPLDALDGWNRLYAGGLAQFQCVLPLAGAAAGLAEILRLVALSGQGAFLSVLKRFGAQKGCFSFPMPGYSLAMDFPINRRSMKLLDDLDKVVCACRGRFYLAKDARMSATVLRACDERVPAFVDMRKDTGCAGRFASIQSRRLDL